MALLKEFPLGCVLARQSGIINSCRPEKVEIIRTFFPELKYKDDRALMSISWNDISTNIVAREGVAYYKKLLENLVDILDNGKRIITINNMLAFNVADLIKSDWAKSSQFRETIIKLIIELNKPLSWFNLEQLIFNFYEALLDDGSIIDQFTEMEPAIANIADICEHFKEMVYYCYKRGSYALNKVVDHRNWRLTDNHEVSLESKLIIDLNIHEIQKIGKAFVKQDDPIIEILGLNKIPERTWVTSSESGIIVPG